jgi:hypothetical protein
METGLLTPAQWDEVSAKALALFARGQKMAAERGLILVDTKYEFGTDDAGNILLADEIHTPDSSRYWIADGYDAALQGHPPAQFDKDVIRSWVVTRCDPYRDPIPEIPAEMIAHRAGLYRRLSGDHRPALRPRHERGNPAGPGPRKPGTFLHALRRQPLAMGTRFAAGSAGVLRGTVTVSTPSFIAALTATLVGIGGQAEAAAEGAILAFAEIPGLALLFPAGLLLALDLDHPALHRQVDVLLGHAGQFGLRGGGKPVSQARAHHAEWLV